MQQQQFDDGLLSLGKNTKTSEEVRGSPPLQSGRWGLYPCDDALLVVDSFTQTAVVLFCLSSLKYAKTKKTSSSLRHA